MFKLSTVLTLIVVLAFASAGITPLFAETRVHETTQSLPTPGMGRAYYLFSYMANGVPASGYNASPYLPKGMKGIGTETASKIWNESRKSYSGSQLKLILAAALGAASNLYGEHSAEYTAVKNASIALNVTSSPLTITSPADGDHWVLGSKHTIRWTYTGNPGGTVKIFLVSTLAGGATVTNSTSIGTNGAGSYVWTVPCNLEPSNYVLTVASNVNSTYVDMASVTAVLQTITVTNPGSGVTWTRGTTHAIKWTYTGGIGATVDIIGIGPGLVNMYGIQMDAASGTAGAGSFSWTIPANNPTGQTKIWIVPSCGPASGSAQGTSASFYVN